MVHLDVVCYNEPFGSPEQWRTAKGSKSMAKRRCGKGLSFRGQWASPCARRSTNDVGLRSFI